MKKILVILTLLFSFSCFSQTQTEKWNSLYNRYEYFNSNGTMIGYKKYNSLYDRWEYYDLKTNNSSNTGYQVQQPVSYGNLELASKVLNSKQAKYDYNVSRVKNKIKVIYESFDYVVLEGSDKTELDYKFTSHLKSIFQSDYIKAVEKKGYDYSDSELTNRIITYLENGSISVLKKEYGFLESSNIEYYNLIVSSFKSLISK